MISNSFDNFQTSTYLAISELNCLSHFMICSAAAANLTDCWIWRCDKNISRSNYWMNENEVMATQIDDSANSSFEVHFMIKANSVTVIVFQNKAHQALKTNW